MWTGVSQKRIATGKIELDNSTVKNSLLDFLRKEVIQPHLPIRLPCYDFTPVIEPAFDSSFLSVRSLASGIPNSHGVTGGVYKTRERIHRSSSDLRLLAIPTSWSRVADSNPDYDRLCEICSTSRFGVPLYRPL